MTSLKEVLVASARAAGIDLVRLGSVRHAVGRRARLMSGLGVDLVIDVGANRGQFGREIRRAGYAGQIVSIEPLAGPFRQLVRASAADHLWTVIQSAVGRQRGTATMHVAANDGASSSLLPMLDLHARSAPNAHYVAEERVDIAPLDELVRPLFGDVRHMFMKLDVQGYELQVLEGGLETLGRSSLVQLELSVLPIYETAPTYRDVLQFMEEHGFRLVGMEPVFMSPTGLLLAADGIFASAQAARTLQG
ncbi:MAG: FkbM family methyltransferase, partial [Actinomycetota bacterium]|nr:FkbM family methyltransferase [Actinomycetota bacterium]